MARPGRDFEIAVAAFYRRIDPSARVLSNHKVRDRDTQTLREADVWIELHVLNKPISVLVSCKDHARPLDIGHIEKFIAEVKSTGASNGVIYARAGFSKNAIEKARINGVSCCRLFQDAPPEEPSELLLETYFASPCYHIFVHCDDPDAPPDLCWRELTIPLPDGRTSEPAPSALSTHCQSLLRHTLAHTDIGLTNALPVMECEARIPIPATTHHPAFTIKIVLIWQWFLGRMDAYRLHGSLDKVKASFVGTAILPRLPLAHPANLPGWQPCHRPADEPTTVRVLITGIAWPHARLIHRHIGSEPLFSGKQWPLGSIEPPQVPSAIAAALANRPHVNLDLQAHFAPKR